MHSDFPLEGGMISSARMNVIILIAYYFYPLLSKQEGKKNKNKNDVVL